MTPRGCWLALLSGALLWTLLGVAALLVWLFTRWWLVFVLVVIFART